MRSRLVVCGVAFISFLVLGVADAQVGGETVTVESGGRLSWSEMREIDAVTRTPTEQRIAPFISVFDLGNSPSPSPAPPQIAPNRGADSVIQGGGLGFSPLSPTATASFSGIPDNNSTIPPDTMGAAGPSHLMIMLNTEVHIQNKVGGIFSTASLNAFWSSLTGTPFDPKLVYDQRENRWLATCDAAARSAGSAVFFAISETSDPTGNWDFYQFDADGADLDWADYPGFGYNKNWIAITNNMFTISTPSTFTGAKMWVIDKSTALAGGPLTMTIFSPGFDSLGGAFGFTLQPCATFGEESTLYILDNGGFTFSDIQLLRLTRIIGTPASPLFSLVPDAGTPPALFGSLFPVNNNFNLTQINAPQLGSSDLIETNDPRIINAVFRNGRVWATHSGGLPAFPSASDRTAAFWYELDPLLLNTTGLPIVKSGVIDGGSGVHHFFPSIAVNSANAAVVGFSRSDSTRFVEAVFASRNSSDPNGTMGAVTLIKAGEDRYEKMFTGTRVRWGDYSATMVDPTDDTTFWTLQEYAETDVGPLTSNDRWGVWWAKIQNQFSPVFVHAGHPGLNDGSVSNPFTDLQDAFGTVTPGGVIYVVAGTYDISTPQTITRAMTINNNGGGNVTIQ